MIRVISLFALAVLSQIAVASPAPTAAPDLEKRYSCYTSTTTVPYTESVDCPPIHARCPPHPECIILEEVTLTVPGLNKDCPITPTVTATAAFACPTCQTGCAIETETVTVTT